jgi:hypothetical protein
MWFRRAPQALEPTRSFGEFGSFVSTEPASLRHEGTFGEVEGQHDIPRVRGPEPCSRPGVITGLPPSRRAERFMTDGDGHLATGHAVPQAEGSLSGCHWRGSDFTEKNT